MHVHVRYDVCMICINISMCTPETCPEYLEKPPARPYLIIMPGSPEDVEKKGLMSKLDVSDQKAMFRFRTRYFG